MEMNRSANSREIDNILNRIEQVEHGFKHINWGADEVMSLYGEKSCFKIALDLFKKESYQARMLATVILGHLADSNEEALLYLKNVVSTDANWRVQEMLAKAFDEICRKRGYEASLSLIEEWMSVENPNTIRAVIEGLRIWTSRPFFKDRPLLAIELISRHKSHPSEYLRKSVGNALRDIGKKHRGLLLGELQNWDLSDPLLLFTYKLVMKQKK
ncbi:MAG: DNA alkylation repair protein [Porphyromonas sp.]|nr:DNA alkylation repair protein [Porphyromonas sp.]